MTRSTTQRSGALILASFVAVAALSISASLAGSATAQHLRTTAPPRGCKPVEEKTGGASSGSSPLKLDAGQRKPDTAHGEIRQVDRPRLDPNHEKQLGPQRKCRPG